MAMKIEEFPEDGVKRYLMPPKDGKQEIVICIKAGYNQENVPACGNNTYKLIYGQVWINDQLLNMLNDKVSINKGVRFNICPLEDSCYIITREVSFST